MASNNDSVLVTGGTGFVGSNVVKHLASNGYDIVLFGRSAEDEDSLRDWYLEDVAENVYNFAGDVLEYQDIATAVERFDVSQIVHTATITPSPEVEREESAFVLQVNIIGTSNVLDAARAHGIERVVYTSSGAVYKPNSELEPIDEYDPLDLNGLYPISKFTSEQLCAYYKEAYGVDTVSTRLGWIYGPMERPVPSRGGTSELFALVNLARRGETVRINDRNRYRDWTHAQDVARGIRLLLEADTLNEPVYNLTCGDAYPGYDVIEKVSETVSPVEVETVDDPSDANVLVNSENRRGPLGIDRLGRETEFDPAFSLRDGLRHYDEWLESVPSDPEIQ